MYIISHVRNTNLGNLNFVNCGCACEILAPPLVITNVAPLHQSCLLRKLPPLPLCDFLARIMLQSEEVWSTLTLVMICKACRNIHHTCAETAHYIHWLDFSCIHIYSEPLRLFIVVIFYLRYAASTCRSKVYMKYGMKQLFMYPILVNFSSVGEDFVQIWQTLIFDNSTNTTQCVYIPIINDDCVEDEPEEFTATLKSDDDRVSFGTNSTTISIFDDDCECPNFV